MNDYPNDDMTLEAAHAMEREGGGFASAIATAYYRADSSNRARLVAAFQDLFARYTPAVNVAAIVADVREFANGRAYGIGWDVVAECYDKRELEELAGLCGSTDAVIDTLAARHNIPARITGDYAVIVNDVDGRRIDQYATLQAAIDRVEQLAGPREEDLRTVLERHGYAVTVTDYGTRVVLQQL